MSKQVNQFLNVSEKKRRSWNEVVEILLLISLDVIFGQHRSYERMCIFLKIVNGSKLGPFIGLKVDFPKYQTVSTAVHTFEIVLVLVIEYLCILSSFCIFENVEYFQFDLSFCLIYLNVRSTSNKCNTRALCEMYLASILWYEGHSALESFFAWAFYPGSF